MENNENNCDGIKIALLGNSGVGKTCIILRYTKNEFDYNSLSTRGANYSSKTITKLGKPTLKTSKYVSSSNISKYLPKYEPKSLNFETEPNRFGDTQTKTETTQDGDYLIKITTSKKKIGEDYGSSNYSSSIVPRSTYLESLSSVTKTIERPTFNFPSSIGVSKQYETKEKRTKTFVDLGKKPETFTF